MLTRLSCWCCHISYSLSSLVSVHGVDPWVGLTFTYCKLPVRWVCRIRSKSVQEIIFSLENWPTSWYKPYVVGLGLIKWVRGQQCLSSTCVFLFKQSVYIVQIMSVVCNSVDICICTWVVFVMCEVDIWHLFCVETSQSMPTHCDRQRVFRWLTGVERGLRTKPYNSQKLKRTEPS